MKDILKSKNILKAEISYEKTRGVFFKQDIRVRYYDDELLFVSAEAPIDFVKPKTNSYVMLVVYKANGLYISRAKVFDVCYTFYDLTYILDTPTEWEHIQRRRSMRCKTDIVGTIMTNQGDISCNIVSVSSYGVSCRVEAFVENSLKKAVYNLEMNFPADYVAQTGYDKLIVPVKMVRQFNAKYGEKYSVFKYCDMKSIQVLILKNFIKKIKKAS